MNGPVVARRGAVQESRDDFLAGARLAEQQHRRVGRRDLRRLRQHLAPLRRLADDAAVAGPRVELVGQRPDARFELRGPRGGFVGALGRFDLALARQHQRDAVGDAARDQHVAVLEGRRRLDEETRARRQTGRRGGPARAAPTEIPAAPTLVVRSVQGRQIVEDIVLPIGFVPQRRRHSVTSGSRGRNAGCWRRRRALAAVGQDTDEQPARRAAAPCCAIAEMRSKTSASSPVSISAASSSSSSSRLAVRARSSSLLPRLLGEPLVRQRERDVIGDAPGDQHIVLRVVAGRPRVEVQSRQTAGPRAGSGTNSIERMPAAIAGRLRVLRALARVVDSTKSQRLGQQAADRASRCRTARQAPRPWLACTRTRVPSSSISAIESASCGRTFWAIADTRSKTSRMSSTPVSVVQQAVEHLEVRRRAHGAPPRGGRLRPIR